MLCVALLWYETHDCVHHKLFVQSYIVIDYNQWDHSPSPKLLSIYMYIYVSMYILSLLYIMLFYRRLVPKRVAQSLRTMKGAPLSTL